MRPYKQKIREYNLSIIRAKITHIGKAPEVMIKLPLYTPDEERNLKSLVYALTQCVSKDKQECGINELIRPAEDEETVQTNEWLEKLFRDLYLFNAPYNLVAASEIVLSATKNNWVCKLTRDEEKFRTSIDDFVGNVRERHLQM